jgi:hypothetical protein
VNVCIYIYIHVCVCIYIRYIHASMHRTTTATDSSRYIHTYIHAQIHVGDELVKIDGKDTVGKVRHAARVCICISKYMCRSTPTM